MRFREIIIELFDPKLAIDLEWAEGSDYVAARGYVTVTNPDGFGGEYGNEEEVELEIEFGEYPHPQRKEYEVQFKVGESFAITGGGNTSVIFATVIQACKDFVEMYKPDRLFFTADEQSRARMYDTITKRVAKQVGWHVLPFDEIQKDPLYRHKSGNGFMFVIAKGEAPEKWSSSQKPQHGSFMPIWFVYNLDKDTPTVAVKVRAPNREIATQHAMKIEPSFKDLDSMQIHALSSLPKREVTDVIDGGTAGENKTVAEDVGQPTFHVSSHDDFETAFEVEMVIDNNNPGFFSYQYFPETDDVENDVYIHSDQYRGQGFGKLLLLKAIETAQQHGLPFKPDRNGISPEQRRVYQSLLNDRLINIGSDSTITLRSKPAVAKNILPHTAGKDQTEMKIGELFGAQDAVNNSVKWRELNDEYIVADFTVGNMKYRFNATTDSDEAPGVWEIEFESIGGPTRFGINQTGRSAEVFTVVVNIIKEFISKKNPKIKRLTFAAKEGSRQDLYVRMVRRLVPDWKFEFDPDDGGFILTKPRPKRVAKGNATAQVQESKKKN